MRVSNNTSYESGIAALNRQQTTQVKTLEQISSGRRMLTPADDPSAYARAMEVSQADSVNTQQATNRQYAASNFAMLEGILGRRDKHVAERAATCRGCRQRHP